MGSVIFTDYTRLPENGFCRNLSPWTIRGHPIEYQFGE